MRIVAGDCRDVMATMEPNSIESIVTDPPYGIEFMGKGWDHEVPGVDFWAAMLRVAKPGAHLIAFGGTRKFHRMWCAIEDAGWEIRDTMMWIYGQGCPHGIDVSKEMDKRRDRSDLEAILAFTAAVRAARDAAGKTNRDIDNLFGFVGMAGHWTTPASQPLIPTVEQWPILRDFLGIADPHMDNEAWRLNGRKGKPGPDWDRRVVVAEVMVSVNPGFSGDRHTTPKRKRYQITAPASEAAKLWEGWTTELKPAWEPICLARKPLIGTVAQNVHAWGVGGLNTRACAIEGADELERHPANLLLDEESAELLDAEVGELESGGYPPEGGLRSGDVYGAPNERGPARFGRSSGGPSRFFYTSKASRRERDLGAVKNGHPTVKPVALMRWLVRLVTPPGGTVLEPFCGSGTTPVACALEGFDCEACDIDPVHAETARRRVEACGSEVDAGTDNRAAVPVEVPVQRSLF